MTPQPDDLKREVMGQLLVDHLRTVHPEIDLERQQEIVQDVSRRVEELWDQIAEEVECKYVAFYLLALGHADLLCRVTDEILGHLLENKVSDLTGRLNIRKN